MIQNYRKPQPQPDPRLPAYWMWKNVIPSYLIQCLDHEMKEVPTFKGGTYETPGAPGIDNQDKTVRNSDILMFDPIHWFCGILFNFALASNRQAEWNINILQPEILQIAFYAPDQHYTWHSDSSIMMKDDIIRKLSVVCMLSDRGEYEGGVFELEDVGEIELEKGDVIVFPSFLKHRVTPVTSGLRKSAVIWVSGYRSW